MDLGWFVWSTLNLDFTQTVDKSRELLGYSRSTFPDERTSSRLMLASRGPNKSLSIVSVILELVPRKGGGNMGLVLALADGQESHMILLCDRVSSVSPRDRFKHFITLIRNSEWLLTDMDTFSGMALIFLSLALVNLGHQNETSRRSPRSRIDPSYDDPWQFNKRNSLRILVSPLQLSTSLTRLNWFSSD